MTVIHDQSDSSLLQEFATHRSQDAFTELVSRHSDWVYSAAARMVRDPDLAEDVAQAVFLVLAGKAAKLSAVPLHRWLFKVTRYASANAIRARARRDKYERLAAMSTRETLPPDPDETWQEIAPILDDSMSRLRSRDRDALLLRFYQQKKLAEIAAALGVSEGAAKIRIVRAIEKLRALLRRRGFAVPSDALGAALLAHTTHAAPATVAAGCLPASASIKATAMSKGVSTMLISTKLKIAAALILIGGIPIGAGVYFLAPSADRSVAAPQQAVAPAAPAVQEPTFGFDPRVAPFVTDRTDLIIAVDVTTIDLDALATDVRTELGQTQMDAPSTARINGLIQTGLGAGKKWINGFEQAGGTSMFLLSRSDELTVSTSPGGSTMKLTATVVYPAQSPEAARTLAKFLTSQGSRGLRVIGSAVVDKPSEPALPRLETLPDPRPALVAGLSAASNSPVRAAVNPLKLKEIIPKLLSSGSVSTNIAGNEWDGVEYASVSLVLPPAESPAFVITSHRKDAASVEAAKTSAEQRIAHAFVKSPPNASTPLAKSMIKFLATEKFAVNGSDLVGTMDLHAYYDLLFAAVNMATQPPASQPQRPPMN
ncbi:MAG: sigma-70 family RNA polymerase sigma factor [Tepidisphaeraceae bacterium]|jgi:RNA polymerase sigma factor (sigma-70 family)